MVQIGPFDLLAHLGSGSSGQVFLGEHRAQKVQVAIKVMTPDVANDAWFRKAFQNEVRAAAGLDHPNIVYLLDYGEIDEQAQLQSQGNLIAGTPYLAMELATGGSLAGAVSRGAGLSWGRVRPVLVTLLDALAHAHARGVIHRDIKPANVLLDAQGNPRLSDFGIAHASEWQTRSGLIETAAGTLHYMAPEQIAGRFRDYGPWTDLFSVGCLAWRLLTGRPPHGDVQGPAALGAQLLEPPPPFEPLAPAPDDLEDWLRILLAKNRFHRYACAADALLALRAIEGDAPPRRPQPLPPVADPDEPAPTLVALESDLPDDVAPALTSRPAVPRRRLPATWRTRRPRVSGQLRGAGVALYALRRPPMVGRVFDRNALWDGLRGVHADQRGALFLLHGPTGTGKSRIAQEICERAHELGAATVVTVRHAASGDGGLDRAIAQFLRTTKLDRREAAERVEEFLDAFGGPDPDLARALTEVVAPASSTAFRTPEVRYRAIRELVERVAHDRPVILWLDDVEWGADAIAFAAHLVRAQEASPIPVLILLTAGDDALEARPDESTLLDDLLALPSTSAIRVGPLDDREQDLLVRRLLGLDGAVATKLAKKTAGNPLFAVQLVKDWVERGILEASAAGLTLRAGKKAVLPDDLHAVWTQRVQAVLAGRPADALRALELAAVLGDEVDLDEWNLVCDDSASGSAGGRVALDAQSLRARAEIMDDLLRHRLAVETDSGFAFTHSMLRTSLERSAAEAGRLESHHRAAARVIRGQMAPGGLRLAERAGRHLLLARRDDEAAELLVQALRDAPGAGARDAQPVLDLADKALKRIGAPKSDPRWGEMMLHRRRVHQHEGRTDEALAWGRRAVEAARRYGWSTLPAALGALANSATHAADHATAEALMLEAMSLFEIRGDEFGVANCLSALAQHAPPERRADYLDRARQLFEKGGHNGKVAHCLRLLAHLEEGAWARGLLERAAVLARGFPLTEGLIANDLADVARREGDLREAAQGYVEALTLLDAAGSAMAVLPMMNLALVRLEQHSYADAMSTLAPALERLEWRRDRPFLDYAYVTMLACAAGTRDWEAFDRCMHAMGELLRDQPHLESDAVATAERAAELASAAGQYNRAKQARLLASHLRRAAP